jgi:parallel beta-helix repeat protein
VTLKDTTITNSAYGIFLNSSSGDVLSGNNITASAYSRIYPYLFQQQHFV